MKKKVVKIPSKKLPSHSQAQKKDADVHVRQE